MQGRKYSAGSGYRYGFNGKENDNDIEGEGNIQDYGFRIYNPRLGRFLSVDPLTSTYPYYTPYQFAGNIPIAAIDLDGLEQYVVIYYKDEHKTTTGIQVRTITDNDGNLLNQHVHKVSDTKDIANGNVLVFESYQQKNGFENMKLVDSRNKPESELTKKELKIFNKHKKQEKETGPTQVLGYGGKPGDNSPSQYESQDFENADTKTFNSRIDIVSRAPIPYQGQTLKPNKKFSFDAIPVYGDQTTPPASATHQAEDLGKALKNTGISSVIIQPIFMDGTGGAGANTTQSNGKTFIQNYYEQYKKLGATIKKASGGVEVKVNYPQISTTSLASQGLQIQTY